MRLVHLLASTALLLPTAALASETIVYTYDAKGRLIGAARSGSVNNGVTSSYAYDNADNRTAYVVNAAVPPSTGAAVSNGSFESPSTGGSFIYRPATTGTTFAGNAGLTANGGPFGFAAPDGAQVAFLQTGSASAVVTLSVSGLTSGSSYVVRFKRQARPGYGGNTLSVSANGTALGTFGATASFDLATSAAFQATGSTGSITFSGETDPGTDRTTGIDAVEILPAATSSVVSIANSSFEQPNTGGSFIYRPTASGATFTGNAGLTANGGGFGFTAPDGAQVAFLQTGSSSPAVVGLSVTGLTVGATYVVQFKRQARPGHGGNAIAVSFGGTALGTFGGTPSFQVATSASFQASATAGTITFSGETDLTTDRATGIDAVEIVRTG